MRMVSEDSIKKHSARIQSALTGAFGVRAKSLSSALRKTGRRLPKRLHAQARLIVDAEGLGGNPRLLRQVDGAALAQAEDAVVRWLDTIDRADRRKGFWIWVGAMIGFNLLLIVAAVVVWMWWTGRV
ncbi:hypothetical protein [uncultured Tateyamaria sp.]|uniref:hypothetical protein n=1 Tax=uncultured Tateyamaria sp. TaxID=455651 RepID=UPI0026211D1D|nr:hypothetical protein [uncultured Tateyamaria sp.]